MKTYNRKIYILPNLNDDLKNRLAHIDNGIANDELIPQGVSFNVSYNRDVVKKINRFSDFLSKSDPSEIEKYFNEREEIKNLDNIYSNLKSYTPNDSYFTLIFYESKGIIRENEYKFLYLLPKNKEFNFDIKADLAKCIEWKIEYIPTETQKRIANYTRNNIVLGAAGTGKTDVAIHSYINAMPIDNIKLTKIKDNVFITYSKKLADYVNYIIDIFWNDYKNPIKKNVYTTKDFFIQILKDNNINIDGYTLKDNKYIKINSKNIELNDNISDFNTFNNWMNNGFINMNKAYVPNLNEIINKYGNDYPYLFFRGVFKGKIINKISDNEISDYFTDKLKIDNKEFESLRNLMNNLFEECDDIESKDEINSWFNKALKRYSNEFKNVPVRFKEFKDFYELFNNYFDFVNPIRNDKKYIDYYNLFKREALLIEGYRGETRKDFDDEIKILYDMCLSYQKYLDDNLLYDDNDLAYFVIINLDKILSNGVFKNIIVDEFQDMTERQIEAIIKLTIGDNNGFCHIFGDFEQTINPTFLQMENVETIYMINNIEDYQRQFLTSSFRYSSAICRELEALRELGKKLFGTEDLKGYVPLVSNANKEFETSGNLLLDLDKGKMMIKEISKAKNLGNIMFIVGDDSAKRELINEYKIDENKIFTVSESKGREEDFVIVYKLCTNKAMEYENLFNDDMSYSRAGRIFYNQLYVGITRCKLNFLQIEDGNKLGIKTKTNLSNIIQILEDENIELFLEELLSQKANFYFRARDSFRNLDFNACKDNLSFYSGTDFDELNKALDLIDKYLNKEDVNKELYELANKYKNKKRFDLARVIYIVLDNNDMISMLNIRENINTDNYTDNDIKNIIINNKDYLDDLDIESISKLGYFDRKIKYLNDKISNIKGVK